MNALHPLGQLFQSVEDSKGWTLREIARRVERSGRTMSHAYVAKLKRDPIKSVTYETIQALAVGLDVPERVVGIAALESMGVHEVDPHEADIAASIVRDPHLEERDRRILLAAVREMQRGRDDETARSDRPTPRSLDDGSVPVEGDAQPDGVTPSAVGERGPRPWDTDEYALAAKRGRNRGREARDQQDRAAEEGGA